MTATNVFGIQSAVKVPLPPFAADPEDNPTLALLKAEVELKHYAKALDWRDVLAEFEMRLGMLVEDIAEREVYGMDVVYFVKLYSSACHMLMLGSGAKIRQAVDASRTAVTKTLNHYNYHQDVNPAKFTAETIESIRQVYASYRKLPKTPAFSATLVKFMVEVDATLKGAK